MIAVGITSSGGGPPIVHIVDDDQSIRLALSRLLRACSYDARGFASARAFLDEVDLSIPGCLLLDLRMPDLPGLDLVEVLQQRQSPFSVILISGRGEIEDSVKAIKLGAIDFLTKPLDQEQLLDRVGAALTLSRTRYAAAIEQRSILRRFATLTPRERQVCELVSRGLPNKQIASQLGASEKTVKIHRGRVMSKLEAHSVPELVRLVDRLGPPPGRY